MKKGIHPESYRTVVFKDFSVDHSFLGKSCADTKDKITWEDGNEYPLVKLEISSASHPFYTGKMKFIDSAGRIDKFRKRYGMKGSKSSAKAEADQAEADAKEAADAKLAADAKSAENKEA